jgi:hypothetical protein
MKTLSDRSSQDVRIETAALLIDALPRISDDEIKDARRAAALSP